MIAFTKRNLKVFFRDRSAVFFSLLASFIIIGLYVLFLGDIYTSDYEDFKNARQMMDHWVMAGLLATTSVTTTMGAFSIMVCDKVQKIRKDFYASPINRKSLAGGYVFSALIIGFIMSVVTFIWAELYIIINGGDILNLSAILKVLFIILIADFTNASMVFFITSFFSSNSAFSTASTVIGTLIGFITGIYLPIGMLPKAVQWIIKLFPTSHAAALMRQVMMEDTLSHAFKGAPQEYLAEFKHMFGITYQFGGHELNGTGSILILLASGAVFFFLAVINLSRKTKG